MRGGVLYEEETEDREPIPGGGGCEGCVTCAELVFGRPGALCFNYASRVVGATLSPEDDASLADLFLNGHWRFETEDGSKFCSSTGCSLLRPSGHILRFMLPQRSSERPDRLVFTDEEGESEYELQLPHDDTHWPPPESSLAPAPSVLEPDMLTQGLVHITYPAEGGGFASCSGFLVSQRHVLTALHCFTDVCPLTDCTFERAPSALVVDPEAVRVRIGGLEAPDGVSFASDPVHTVLDIHPYTDTTVDLALVELASSTNGSPLTLGHTLSNSKSALFTAFGYGVAGVPVGGSPQVYDWGRLKRMSLTPEASAEIEFIKFSASDGDPGPCRGDSGGPVLREEKAVGMLVARDITPRGPHTSSEASGIELIAGRSFRFTNHNACGRGGPNDEITYLAVNLAEPMIRAWIEDFVAEASPLPVP